MRRPLVVLLALLPLAGGCYDVDSLLHLYKGDGAAFGDGGSSSAPADQSVATDMTTTAPPDLSSPPLPDLSSVVAIDLATP